MKTYSQNKTTITKSPLLAEIQLSYKTKVKPADRPTIRTAHDAATLLQSIYDGDTVEHVEQGVIILLNTRCQMLGWCKVSTGGITGTVMDIRVIFQLALNGNASGIIVSHNHPSGSCTPSNEDIQVTKQLREAGKLMNISLYDHIIFTPDDFYSFANEGLL